jgi:hypothetical protein
MVTRINPPEHDSTSLAAGGWPIVGDVEADGCIGCPPNSRHAGHVGKIVFYRRKTALRQALDTPEGYYRKHDEVCTQWAEAGHGMSWQLQRTFWIGACASLRRS